MGILNLVVSRMTGPIPQPGCQPGMPTERVELLNFSIVLLARATGYEGGVIVEVLIGYV